MEEWACLHLCLPFPAPIVVPAIGQLRHTFGHGIPFPNVLRSSLDPTLKLGAGRVQEGVEKTGESMAAW